MAQPTVYDRQFNFQNQQALTPTTPLPANQVDAEYNAIKITLDEILANLALIQRDDGELANETVGLDQLKPELTLLGSSLASILAASEAAVAASEAAVAAAASAEEDAEAAEARATSAAADAATAETAKTTAVAAKDDAITAKIAAEAALAAVPDAATSAIAAAPVIRYNAAQALTSGEQEQARENVGIDASSFSLGLFSESSAADWQDALGLRKELATQLVLYVNATTGNDNNDGLTPSTAFRTRQKAVDYAYANFVLKLGQIVVRLQGGPFTDSMQLAGPMVGQINPGQFMIEGDSSIDPETGQYNYDAVVIAPTGTNVALALSHGAMATWRFLKVDGTNTNNDLIQVGNGAQLDMGDNTAGWKVARINETGDIGDTHSITFTSTHHGTGISFPVTISHTTTVNDTVETIADALVAAINANTTLANSGLVAETFAPGIFYIRDPLPKASIQSAGGSSGASATDTEVDWMRTFEMGPTFPSGGLSHFAVANNANVTFLSSYAISGGGQTHINAAAGSTIAFNNNGQPDWFNIKLSNEPEFTAGFLYVATGAKVNFQAIGFSGSGATGVQYVVKDGSLDEGIGTEFPGDVPGIAAQQLGGYFLSDGVAKPLVLYETEPGDYSGVITKAEIHFRTPDGAGNQGGILETQGNGPVVFQSDTYDGTLEFYPNGDGSSNFLVLENAAPIYQSWYDGTTRLQAGVGGSIAHIGTVTAHQLYFQTGATNRWGIGTSGGLYSNGLADMGAGKINALGYYVNGTTGTPSYSFASDPDTGIRLIGADVFALVAGGSDIAGVTPSGLSVAGNLVVAGDLYIRDDTNPSHYLIQTWAEDGSADHTLSWKVNGGSRTLDLGASLTLPADPNADRLFGWDDSEGKTAYFTLGAGISIDGTSLKAGASVGGYHASRYHGGMSMSLNAAATVTLTADTLYAIPFDVTDDATFTKIGIDVLSPGAAGKKARLGIYTRANGLPGSLVLDCGEVNVDSTGVKELTISAPLKVGAYVTTVVSDGAPGLQGNSSLAPGGQFAWGIGTPGTLDHNVNRSFTYGALPSSWGSPTFNTGSIPFVFMRVA